MRFRVTHKQMVGTAEFPAPAARYRVRGTATTSGQNTDVYLDMIVLGRGQTIAVLSLSSVESPVGGRLERRLARKAARRLSAA